MGKAIKSQRRCKTVNRADDKIEVRTSKSDTIGDGNPSLRQATHQMKTRRNIVHKINCLQKKAQNQKGT